MGSRNKWRGPARGTGFCNCLTVLCHERAGPPRTGNSKWLIGFWPNATITGNSPPFGSRHTCPGGKRAVIVPRVSGRRSAQYLHDPLHESVKRLFSRRRVLQVLQVCS